MKNCFVLVTHKIDNYVLNKWTRMKSDFAMSDVSCYLAVDFTRLPQVDDSILHSAVNDKVVDLKDIWAFDEGSIKRYLQNIGYDIQYYEPGGRLFYGNIMLAFMTFFLNHYNFDYYWFVEWDVAYSGNWSYLCSKNDNNDADYISYSCLTNTYSNPSWFHYGQWSTKTIDPFKEEELVKTFNPIMRLSKRALEHLDMVYKKGNSGFYEIFLGTVLKRDGYKLGGFLENGDLTPDGFIYLPGGRSLDFNSVKVKPNKLYHPVKLQPPF